jgi:LytR cell envelope-related transcriptional attenuator
MSAALAYGTLSVHHFISQVGDYVGFAAIVAVAIMVLLLFAHARETADLRRRAEDAEDELALLHEQVQWLRGAQQSAGGAQQPATAPPPGAATAAAAAAAGARAVPPPGATPTPAAASGRSVATAGATAAMATAAQGSSSAGAPTPAPAAAGRAVPVVPAAPVGVGAPALSSATKLIPPTDDELRAVAAAAAVREAGSGSPAPSGAAAQAESGSADAPPPATVAAGRNGNPPPGRGGVAAPPPRGGGGRPGQPAGAVSPRRNYASNGERSGGRRTGRLLAGLATLLVIAIAVVVVVLVVGNKNSSSGDHASGATAPSHASKGAHKGAKHGKGGNVAAVNVDPTSVTVSVLNGTMTTNLAADVSNKLTAKGFQAGSTGNAVDQSMSTTVVGYVPSAQNAKDDAYAVAHTLGLKQNAVKPVSSANQTVACSGETNCPDQVIVTVGADLNSDAT